MQQPYTLEEIDEKDFNEKVDKMVKAIEEVKDIIVCDLTGEDCPKTCPLHSVCKQMNVIVMWGMLRKILPENE